MARSRRRGLHGAGCRPMRRWVPILQACNCSLLTNRNWLGPGEGRLVEAASAMVPPRPLDARGGAGVGHLGSSKVQAWATRDTWARATSDLPVERQQILHTVRTPRRRRSGPRPTRAAMPARRNKEV